MNLLDAKKVYFVGIGGIGMSALAKFFLSQGKHVEGSDLHVSDLTNMLTSRGVVIHTDHHGDYVTRDTDLLIYSPAVPLNNHEREKARRLGIRECSYPQALGELSKQYSTIVVTGTHGKSTTTAMLGLMLEAVGYDPTVIVGSLVPSFAEGNLRVGKGRFLVIEGCEHQANMLHLHPEMIVLTSIEEDHLDFYKTLENIRQTFQKFVDKLSSKGMVIVNADDPVSQTLQIHHKVSYGSHARADYQFSNRRVVNGLQQTLVHRFIPEEQLGEITLKIPGRFNVANALAATTAAMELGVPFETCARVLAEFPGIWRRFERVGMYKGVEVISDYGHHPTAIRATLEAARELFPDKKLVLCFQPHQHSRTQAMFDGFVEALSGADAVVLPEIYRVEGRTEDESVSSQHLCEAIQKKRSDLPVYYAQTFEEAQTKLSELIERNHESVLIIQGAGTIDELARMITSL